MADGDSGQSASSGRSGRETWRAHRPDEDNQLGSLWIRWTDGGADLHFHRVCEIVPQLAVTRRPPFVRSVPETGERPTFTPVRGGEEGEPVPFRFVSGLPRELIRHVPLVVLVVALALFVGAEFTPHVDGVSTLIPTVSGANAVLFGVFVLITPVLLWLFSSVDVVESRELPSALVVYGLIGFLGAGVVASILLTITASHPSETPPNVVFVSGYLLVLLVGGQLLYEGTLRIEHLFVKLGRRDGDIVGNTQAYRRFLTDLHDALNDRIVFGLKPSRLFGVLFAAQFAIIWIIGDGPQTLDYGLGLAMNFGLNAVLATVAFQFLVVVRYFYQLMATTETYADVNLTYEPFHVDGHGGFRDFGRFATRINVILTAGGLYLVYRFYLIGGRTLPVDGVFGFQDPILLSVWLISFAGPVIAYALGAGAWGYYSFWTMHTKMVRDKNTLARRYQGTRGDVDRDRTPSAGDSIEEFDQTAGPEWAALMSAPTWPLDVNTMVSLASGSAAPLLLPASNLLF